MTRLAPSPTGALHLGNARTFLLTWAIARQRGWKLILRIEDLDTPRVKAESVRSILETFEWLGIDWDGSEGARSALGEGVLVQSEDLGPYVAAMRVLARSGLAYPCELSRAQIESAASAPQEGAHEIAFPRSLRPADARTPREFAPAGAAGSADTLTNWRFVLPDDPGGRGSTVEFVDHFAGAQKIDPAASVGDFILWTKRGQPSYQLAVVVDDQRQHVTDVIRGNDLLDSAARQVLLMRALGYERVPEYWHLPLVVGEDGRRLAKRHGDTRVEAYRARGVPPEAVIGLIACWSGVGGEQEGHAREPMCMNAGEFLARLDCAKVPRTNTTFTQRDDQWLVLQARRKG